MKIRRTILCWLGVAALVVSAAAQQKTLENAKAPTKGKAPGVLLPDMKAETGSYESPHGKLGKEPNQLWTMTTVAAAVDQKMLPAKKETVVGEIVEFSCYLQVGKHGEKHRSCAQKCITNGQPIGLLTKDGTLYMLMEEEHDPRRDGLTDFRQAAADHASHIMEVTGTSSQHGGYKALYVQGYLKK
ncbi:MAG: hypothetical protein ACRD7E_27855 [Bryobacteraceae bacterium]